MLSCNDLLNLNIFENIKLVAGKNGIYKTISWPYICQTLDFSEWVNGGELMFLTGMNMDLNDEKIIDLIYECIRKDISGLVILTSREYISFISEEVKNTCDSLGLPLFDMPWNIKLIDVNKEIANYIMELNSKQKNERELFFELLFSSDLDKERLNKFINKSNIKVDKDVFVSTFIINGEYSFKKSTNEYLLNIVKSTLSKHNISFIVDLYEEKIICIVQINDDENLDNLKNILNSIGDTLSKYADTSLVIGGVYSNIYAIRESYNECIKTYKLYKSNNWEFKFIDYKEIGFYKILFKVANIYSLKCYCNDVLGQIMESDKNCDLLKTLRCYLKNSCNLINTSKELFIHRNTLIYRLNKVKAILNSNLEDQTVKNELMNAIMIYDYLKSLD